MSIFDFLWKSKRKITNTDMYREFKDEKEIRDWGAEHYGTWSQEYLAALPERDKHREGWLARQPIENYCGEVFRDINPALWTEKTLSDQYMEMELLLKNIIASAPHIPEPVTAYRLENNHVLAFIESSLKSGKPFTYESYMSASLLMDTMLWTEATYSDRNALLKLYIPSGTPGIYADVICNRNERELLLQRGLRVRVLRHRRNEIIGKRFDKGSGRERLVKKTVYECQVVPQDRADF